MAAKHHEAKCSICGVKVDVDRVVFVTSDDVSRPVLFGPATVCNEERDAEWLR